MQIRTMFWKYWNKYVNMLNMYKVRFVGWPGKLIALVSLNLTKFSLNNMQTWRTRQSIKLSSFWQEMLRGCRLRAVSPLLCASLFKNALIYWLVVFDCRRTRRAVKCFPWRWNLENAIVVFFLRNQSSVSGKRANTNGHCVQ